MSLLSIKDGPSVSAVMMDRFEARPESKRQPAGRSIRSKNTYIIPRRKYFNSYVQRRRVWFRFFFPFGIVAVFTKYFVIPLMTAVRYWTEVTPCESWVFPLWASVSLPRLYAGPGRAYVAHTHVVGEPRPRRRPRQPFCCLSKPTVCHYTLARGRRENYAISMHFSPVFPAIAQITHCVRCLYIGESGYGGTANNIRTFYKATGTLISWI